MVVSESEVNDLQSDPAFLREREEIYGGLSLPQGTSLSPCGIDRLIVAEYVRRRHGRRCVFVLQGDAAPCKLVTGCDASLAKWLGVICEGHSLSIDEVCKTDRYPVDLEIDGQQANIQFLTLCLRLGDLLDIDTRRASPFLRNLSEPLSILSASHWDQYGDIHVRGLSPGRSIVIGGTCPTQESERVLREWVKWLEVEWRGPCLCCT